MVTLEEARRVIEAAERRAAEIGHPMNTGPSEPQGRHSVTPVRLKYLLDRSRSLFCQVQNAGAVPGRRYSLSGKGAAHE